VGAVLAAAALVLAVLSAALERRGSGVPSDVVAASVPAGQQPTAVHH
jgi:DHA1 family inner membrane transport protein